MKRKLIRIAAAAVSLTLIGSTLLVATPKAEDGPAVIAGPAVTGKAADLAVAEGGPAKGKRDAKLDVVALFPGLEMPTGVTVSKAGRIFLCFPRWNDKVAATAVELKDGKLVPFPSAAVNEFVPGKSDPKTQLVSVQSVVVDAHDRLWLLDPGSLNTEPPLDGGPKLWGYDLATGRSIKAVTFPRDVVLGKTYLNDIRFDLTRGPEGTAYITDSGAGGIIVIDLATGASWRHLDGHPSVLPTPGLKQTVEGKDFLQRKPNGEVASPTFRSDGIALSPDGKTLYYTGVASRDVWAVPTDLLADKTTAPAKLAAAVKKVADKPSGSDGIACDAKGRIYTTDFEDGAIRRIDPATGSVEVVTQDERLLWPDTLAIHGGYLYVTSNQLARQPNYWFGKEHRKPPYALFRIPVENAAQPAPTK